MKNISMNNIGNTEAFRTINLLIDQKIDIINDI